MSTQAPPTGLGMELVGVMPQMTDHRIGELAMRNAQANRPYFKEGQSIRGLRNAGVGRSNAAVVVAAGPSLHRKDFAGELRDSGFDGAVVATDSSMVYCLRNGIVPDLVVTIDPHAKRIVRWFGDPALTEACLKADDYFSRQDMDRAFADELAHNRTVLSLIDQYGPRIRLALSTVSPEPVVKRALESGMQIHWWNPMMDDPDANPQGRTQQLFELNGFPCINAGGNVGAACWMMAGEVLGKAHVALLGMDFSYYEGTPARATQYYDAAVRILGEERIHEMFIHTHNPHLDKWFFSDPAYYWFREIFLEMARDSGVKTYNCTEGGILFGESVAFIPFAEFLERWRTGRLA